MGKRKKPHEGRGSRSELFRVISARPLEYSFGVARKKKKKKKDFVKITIFTRQFLFDYSYLNNCYGDKKIVKATKNNCYFDRHGCGLYRNKA